MAPSDLCVNFSDATVGDCFWSNDISQGISVAPKQLIYLNPFVTFPQPPGGHVPFNFSHSTGSSSEDAVIYVLIETDLLPLFNQEAPALEVSVVLA